MVALGRPGAGEALLAEMGFSDVERIDVPFVFEFADPEAYARALASTGPAFEAIQAVGEKSFLESAVELGRQHIRKGLPLRAPIALVGYIAAKPSRRTPRSSDSTAPAEHVPTGFLSAPRHTPEAQRLYDEDLKGVGYKTNVVAPLGAPTSGIEPPLRSHGGDDPRRLSLLHPAGRARDGGSVGCGRLLLLDGMGQEACRGNESQTLPPLSSGEAWRASTTPSRRWPTGLDSWPGTRTRSRPTMSRRCATLGSTTPRSLP